MNRKGLLWAAGALISVSCGTAFRKACIGALTLSLLGAAAGFAAGPVELLSRLPPGQVSGTGGGVWFDSYFIVFRPSLSDDGRYAVFHSYETNLVPGERDLNDDLDLYAQDLLTGTTSLVSHAMDAPATTGNAPTGEAAISGDGRWIAFTSRATNLVPGLPEKPVEPPSSSGALYLYDRVADVITLVTNRPPNDFYALTISRDGRYVAFTSQAADLVPGQRGVPGYNVFLYDRVARSFQLISHTAASPVTGAGASSRAPLLSADARWVAFLSQSPDLAPGTPSGDTAFFYETATGTVTPAGPAGAMALSADGRYLAVHGSQSAYLFDRVTRTRTPLAVSPDSNLDDSSALAISADGRWVALTELSNQLVPPQPGSAFGLYLYDRVSATFTLVSRKLGAATAATAIGGAYDPRISADGRLVAFTSREPDLVAGQVNPTTESNIFLYDRKLGHDGPGEPRGRFGRHHRRRLLLQPRDQRGRLPGRLPERGRQPGGRRPGPQPDLRRLRLHGRLGGAGGGLPPSRGPALHHRGDRQRRRRPERGRPLGRRRAAPPV